MTRIIAVLGMIALCACSGPGPEPTRAAAETALARGQLAEVDRYVAQGLALTAAEPQSVWAWRFKLLGVEAQISRLAIADAEQALAAPVPAGADFAVVRGRQKFLLARVQVLQGKLKEAAVTPRRGGAWPRPSIASCSSTSRSSPARSGFAPDSGPRPSRACAR